MAHIWIADRDEKRLRKLAKTEYRKLAGQIAVLLNHYELSKKRKPQSAGKDAVGA